MRQTQTKTLPIPVSRTLIFAIAVGLAIGLWLTVSPVFSAGLGTSLTDSRPGTIQRNSPAQIPGAVADIMDLVNRGEYGAAESRINENLDKRPRDAESLFLKGVVLSRQGRIDEAIAVFESLTVAYPDQPEPYNNLAVLYAANRQYDKAKEALIKALGTDNSYATAYRNLTDVYAIMAGQAYDKALEIRNADAVPENPLAMIVQPPAARPDDTDPAAPVLATVESAPADRASDPVLDTEPPETSSSRLLAGIGEDAGAEPGTVPTSIPAVTGSRESAQSMEVRTPVTTGGLEPPVPVPVASVDAVVNAWSEAWSDQDADRYLLAYHDEFETPNGEDRAVWAQSRRIRIVGPEFIEVEVQGLSIADGPSGTAVADFVQSYRSNMFRAKVRKTLVFRKTDAGWKITREVVNR